MDSAVASTLAAPIMHALPWCASAHGAAACWPAGGCYAASRCAPGATIRFPNTSTSRAAAAKAIHPIATDWLGKNAERVNEGRHYLRRPAYGNSPRRACVALPRRRDLSDELRLLRGCLHRHSAVDNPDTRNGIFRRSPTPIITRSESAAMIDAQHAAASGKLRRRHPRLHVLHISTAAASWVLWGTRLVITSLSPAGGGVRQGAAWLSGRGRAGSGWCTAARCCR